MTCSIVFGYGVYEALYEDMSTQSATPFTGQSSALITLIGILAIAFMTIGGPWAILWAKLFSPQLVVSSGGLIFGIAFILASFGTKLWHFALTQGVLAGVGTCLSYVTTTAVVPGWFEKNRSLAMGVVFAATGVGGMIWPPILRALITSVGFRNTLRISGSISGIMVMLAGLGLAWDLKTAQVANVEAISLKRRRWAFARVPVIDFKIAKTNRFIILAFGNFIQSAAYSTPLFFYAAYAQALGYDKNTASVFITISNASNFVSRLIIGWAADRYGRLNALAVCTVISATAVFGFWAPSTLCRAPGCRTKADVLFILFAILYGSFAGAFISLFPASLLELFGRKDYAGVNGSLSFIRGTGALLGTPLTSLLVRRATALTSPPGYERATITVGVLMVVAAICTVCVRVEFTSGQAWKWKA